MVQFIVRVCCFFVFLGYATAGKVNVNFFPMVHPGKGMDESPALYEAVMKSQHQLMLYLKENPDTVVFLESLYEELDQSYFEGKGEEYELRDFFRKSIQVNFPNGIPANYEDLNDVQKMIIADQGTAANIFFQLGLIPSLQPTNSKEDFVRYVKQNLERPDADKLIDIIDGRAQPASDQEALEAATLRFEVMSVRERLALKSIQAYAKKNPSVGTVTLVYGAAHDFYQYRDIEEYADLNIRKVNVKRYTKNKAEVGALNLLLNNPEPRFENYRYNPKTGLYEMIPGTFF